MEHLPLADVVYSINEAGELHKETDVRKFVRETDAQQKLQQGEKGKKASADITASSSERASVDVQDTPELSDSVSSRRKGDFSLYTYYLKEMGWPRVALWVFLIILTGAGEKIPRRFLCLCSSPITRCMLILP